MNLRQITAILIAMVAAMAFQSCQEDKATIEVNTLTFTVANLSTEKEMTATSGMVNGTVTTTVTINGVSTTVTRKTNELPAKAGDILEVRFSPEDDCTEAYFSMPDGKVMHATASNSSLKWTVPYNFTDGMEIKGENSYETADSKVIQTGKVTLIAY